jgi:hypothetical protein
VPQRRFTRQTFDVVEAVVTLHDSEKNSFEPDQVQMRHAHAEFECPYCHTAGMICEEEDGQVTEYFSLTCKSDGLTFLVHISQNVN